MKYDHIVFIDGDCADLISKEDLEILNNNFESYTCIWNESKTFKLEIIFDPLYNMIHAWHRAPDQYKMNERREDILKLEKYLPIATIETLSYLDYLGEKIYSCVKQLPLDSEEDYPDWDILNSNDLYKLMTGLEKYLQTNYVQNHEIVNELVGQIKIMAEVARKYKLDIILFDEDF